VASLSKKELLAIIEKQSAQLKKYEAIIDKQDRRIAELETENVLLRQKVYLLVRRLFGPSSEKLDAAQLDLFLAQTENAPGKAPASSLAEEADPQRSHHRPEPRQKRLPDDLPVIEEVLDPEEVKAAPQNWRCIGQEISEQLDYEPAHFLRRRLVRRKYVSRLDAQAVPVIAELPSMLQQRSTVAPGLLAQIIVSKYVHHLPLYRQEQMYWTAHRVWLPRQNLAYWMGLSADWLRPIYEAIRTGVMAGGYVQVDETPVPYLDPGHGKTKTGYFWTASRPGGDVVYRWQTSRGAACLNSVLPVDFRGTVQCDGYAAYASFARKKEHLQLAACWAHVRRKFHEAREQDPLVAAWLLRQIGHLYRLERKLRRTKSGPQLRAATRAHQANPVYARLHRVLTRLKMKRRHLPRSAMGLAIDYTLNLWPQLGIYLGDGRIEIDQNLVENAIRPTALGKKNWLFIGEADAGQRSAVLYTIVECCRRRGLDPFAYLRHVLTQLPHSTNRQIDQLTPEAWARQTQSFQRAA
jgi:transposase